MKNLGEARKILEMFIMRDERKGELKVSQKKYLQQVLTRFGMKESKAVLTPIAQHFKLSSQQCPTTTEEVQFMSKVPYSNVVGCLMCAMVCSRPDLAFAVSLISRFMSKPSKEH